MNKEEKSLIFDLLKKASASISGYTTGDFLQTPDFSDDIVKSQGASIQQAVKEAQNVPAQAGAHPAQAVAQAVAPAGASLESINAQIAQCSRCSLSKSRHNTVPGMGVSNPDVLVIGEAPGYEEDMQGLPFVGPAGQLLDKMLGAIQLSRTSNTYILNILKCRPPQNRTPYPEEAEACSSFLKAQIALLKPKMILCAGSTAAKNLLNTAMGVTRLRQQIHEYAGIPVCVTYHPSYLLQHQEFKAQAWDDLKMFREQLLKTAPDYQKSFRG
ncbi:MAG TPA: uracil-DNA glycosylase [Treponema sp.]|nr:uracil-DNA glycosylase [Treponema sp.]